jgi:hypothetical protein
MAVRASEIRNRESFEAWLEGRPEESRRAEAIALAHRVAMRSAPFLHETGDLSPGQHATLLRSVLWANTLSRVAATYPTRESEVIRAAARAAAAFAASASASAAAFASARAADAAAFAADAAAFAAAFAASASASARAAAATWNELAQDAGRLETGLSVQALLNLPIWQEPPPWWHEERHRFMEFLKDREKAEPGWSIWIDWYNSLSAGHPAFFLKNREKAGLLLRNIALGSTDGTFNEKFWQREPHLINADIKGWVEEAKSTDFDMEEPDIDDEEGHASPVFISYSKADEANARRIGSIIEQGGFRVFAQYKDMPPGSNFVAEIQAGLADMGKFVHLYSPDYLSSADCQAEFNAAHQMDPLGKRRLIVGLLLKPMRLLPLLPGIVYLPLYDRSPEEAKADILRALSGELLMKSAAEWREEASRSSTHEVVQQADGRWHMQPTVQEKTPFIDDYLLNLPSHLQDLAETLKEALSPAQSNAPAFMQKVLENYIKELVQFGNDASAQNLESWANILRVQSISDADASWVSSRKGLISEFLNTHVTYVQHYPALLRRDFLAAHSTIDPATFDDPAFRKKAESLLAETKSAHRNGQVTDGFLKIVEEDERQRKMIAESLSQHVPSSRERLLEGTGELSADEVKKRFLFTKGGKWARVQKTMGKVAQNAAGKAAADAIVDAAKWLLEMIF